ncbi:hypothetical protein NDU88_001703 [Pleurodeles waltl]|uniref:Uncharacterized protein n=1 Tax=Pleurodeles waltl TaxID=8319 RepID=A0AAV7VCH3_PLEWA|nr:hypothetical protein NDU88_001703 [Pleurodeles waltl]
MTHKRAIQAAHRVTMFHARKAWKPPKTGWKSGGAPPLRTAEAHEPDTIKEGCGLISIKKPVFLALLQSYGVPLHGHSSDEKNEPRGSECHVEIATENMVHLFHLRKVCVVRVAFNMASLALQGMREMVCVRIVSMVLRGMHCYRLKSKTYLAEQPALVSEWQGQEKRDCESPQRAPRNPKTAPAKKAAKNTSKTKKSPAKVVKLKNPPEVMERKATKPQAAKPKPTSSARQLTSHDEHCVLCACTP